MSSSIGPDQSVGTSLEPGDLASSSSVRPKPIKSALIGAAIGAHRAISVDTFPGVGIIGTGAPHCEFNQRQAQVHELYLQLLGQLGAIARSELQPGQRREALSFLNQVSSNAGELFLSAFERIFYTNSKKISDRTKSSALRFCSDFAPSKEKAKYIYFLITQLSSSSPAQASAAAVGLSEIADKFSVPALIAASKQVIWPSVRSDIDQTINEISAQ